MRILFTALLVAATLTPAYAARREASVPAQFRGEWNSNLRHCGTALNESRLIIGANTVRWYESQGAVHAVVSNGTRDLALIAELHGEGEHWLSPTHFKLDSKQRTLTDVTHESAPVKRYKCPVKR